MKRSRTSGVSPDSKDLMLSHHASVRDAGLAHRNGLTNPDLSLAQRHSCHRRRAGASEGADQKLFKLCLGGTQVTDAGLAHLKGLTNISILDLGDTQVTDAGLAHLKGLTKLSHVVLSGTLVTDGGLVHFKEGLSSLYFGGHGGGGGDGEDGGQALQVGALGSLSWGHPLAESAADYTLFPDHPIFVPGRLLLVHVGEVYDARLSSLR